MTSRTATYGAIELKLVAQRYWFFGFLLSIIIHSTVLGLLHMPWFDGGMDMSKMHLHTPKLIGSTTIQPIVPAIAPLPKMSSEPSRLHAERAMPVPVPNDVADPEKTMASQRDLAADINPLGIESGTEEGTLSSTIPLKTDEPPVPFYAVEKLPMVVTRVLPEYPPLAQRACIEGKVIVNILVGKDGRVRDARVLRRLRKNAAARARWSPSPQG